jgi:hypothetical protein
MTKENHGPDCKTDLDPRRGGDPSISSRLQRCTSKLKTHVSLTLPAAVALPKTMKLPSSLTKLVAKKLLHSTELESQTAGFMAGREPCKCSKTAQAIGMLQI